MTLNMEIQLEFSYNPKSSLDEHVKDGHSTIRIGTIAVAMVSCSGDAGREELERAVISGSLF